MTILFTVSNEGNQIEFELKDQPITLGRGDKCDIVLSDEKCSSLHCEFSMKSKKVFIKDLNSKNGTHVNGEAVSSLAIAINDVIQIGTSYITVVENALSTIEKMAFTKVSRSSKKDLTLPILKPSQHHEKSRTDQRYHSMNEKTEVSVVKKVKKLSEYHRKKA
ncbi:MAG: hypothetical protein COW00_08130 [Bdellovibrio sp. CG12_big_fil_rev_8_21_14_0_65_39_13]|nr:MAG: hypothetical protein COW78_11715 [Bdellovibrio sp. CG22_combo_CG10-13_8_21_14_all_39_27]PIQ60011.1 MAG: hypothetical protein COW00_08130 [Bdellovibrio sp. CG12_big_fil_rev_8_21_14_0_65_39_13]PIR35270.1 MAG: hypothetical protein COV37_09240 [Bdellovibrio sp. CG11_big_fil_rev_8_21_14_0_20_39_38]PJB53008.1 MAG: hypothetical protein CO099_09530 [Bdellovibrio sp. CG_4_9_14_3_um_filter_39_7]